MIDIHTHILPNIDDGAGSVEEAIDMTASLYMQGIYTAVCTPHFDPTGMALQDFISRRDNAITLMSASRVTLISASETAFHEYLFHYPDLSGLYMGNTRYLLLELPYQRVWEKVLFLRLERLINYYDCIPIIAHIERYPAANRKNINRLIELGCLMQMNASALLDRSLRKKALRMIRQEKIDLLGSDCHNRKERPPNLAPACDIIEGELGLKYLEKLKNNSEALMKDIDIRNLREY